MEFGDGGNGSENQDQASSQPNYDDNPYLSVGKSPGHLSQALNALQAVQNPNPAPGENSIKAAKKAGGMFGGGLANKLFSRESAQVPSIQ